MSGTEVLDGFAAESSTAESVAIGSLEPGTTLIVITQRSEYRLVTPADHHVARPFHFE